MLSINKKEKVKTRNLDEAAMLLCFGGSLLGIEGKYPENIFYVKASKILVEYSEKAWVPYRKFCNKRKKLKTKCRKRDGLPEHFTGKKRKYKMSKIAKVRSFTKTEKENLSSS